jgi:hypothetical protein
MPVNRQRERGSHRGLVFCTGDRRPELRHDRDGHSSAMASLCGRPLPLTGRKGQTESAVRNLPTNFGQL